MVLFPNNSAIVAHYWNMLHAWLNTLFSMMSAQQAISGTTTGRPTFLLCTDIQNVSVNWPKWSSLILCFSNLCPFMCIAIFESRMSGCVWLLPGNNFLSGPKQGLQLWVLWDELFNKSLPRLTPGDWGWNLSGMTDAQTRWSLAWGCVYTVNLYISAFVSGARTFFLLGFPKALKEKEISTKHRGLITVQKQKQPQLHCSITIRRLSNCFLQQWYWSNNRQAMSRCDFFFSPTQFQSADSLLTTSSTHNLSQRLTEQENKMGIWRLDYQVVCERVFHTIKCLAPALAPLAWLNRWQWGKCRLLNVSIAGI